MKNKSKIDYKKFIGQEIEFIFDSGEKKTGIVQDIDPEMGLSIKEKSTDIYLCCYDLTGVKQSHEVFTKEYHQVCFNYVIECLINNKAILEKEWDRIDEEILGKRIWGNNPTSNMCVFT